ncbi:phage integrase family protein [Variovorax sp. CF079]|uniref:phage integrase family protein n=1 Tax=Variovorax sp. CF079 TaxID=1882774 RepID=UPI001FCD0705|nr:phage integrase family protein [Variovorax sp. CF079]
MARGPGGQDPRLVDSVAAWLHPSLAARLERAGVLTLFALVERIRCRVSANSRPPGSWTGQ